MPDPTPPSVKPRFGLSLAARLVLGFACIAIVVVVGYQAAQRDLRTAFDTLRATQTEQVPLSRVADALTYHVVAFDRAVLAEVRAPDEANRAGVAQAEAALLASLESYAQMQPGAAQDIEQFRAETTEHTRLGWSLIEIGAERQRALNDIRTALDQLTRRISTAFGTDAQLPDPALTRRAYAELELDLGRLRTAFNGYLVGGAEGSESALRTATRSLRATFSEYRGELQKSPGRAWTELVEEDLAQVERLQLEVIGQDQQIQTLRGHFAESGLQLPLRLDSALAEPASRALVESAETAAAATRSAEDAIEQLVYRVLAVTLLVSLLTVLAVTIPVKRLTTATRALARGGHDVRVQSGGSSELSELGEAFNQMAEQLAKADAEVAEQRAQLENRVRARTRKLTHLANHDPLSGLPNRRFAFNHLRRAVRSMTSQGTGIGLIAIDIDNFKVINDNFGHNIGDALLRAVADRVRMLVGERRFVARLGGDEFLICVEDTNAAEATAILADRLINGFRAPLSLDGRDILVSISVGTAQLPEHASDASSLVRAADAALFSAKSLGRNRIAVFSQSLLEGAETRFATEQALRRAVEAQEFGLVFQPQVSVVDGTTEVMEALLRWRRSDGTLVPAGEFIAIAEQSGLIIEIGDWVLETAAAAVAGWRMNGLASARVAINVSVHQLLDNRFVERLSQTLSRYQLPAEAIELELTETAFQTSSSTVEALRRVRDDGISLALDDFGTGYSSLTSLSRLPLKRVKIDRSLIVDAPGSKRAESLARSIIGVCHNLGLGVTVEGIERVEQLAWLAGCGPVHVQGFLIARPMPRDAVADFAAGSRGLMDALLASAEPQPGGRRIDDPVVPFRPGAGKKHR